MRAILFLALLAPIMAFDVQINRKLFFFWNIFNVFTKKIYY